MGITKTDLFTANQNELARMAKALAHPARIAIIQYLLKTNTCVNGTLVQELGLAQATISQHLKELKEIGLLQGTIEGASMSYCIHPGKWEETQKLLNELFNSYRSSSGDGNCC
ncbi:metalloregulator ArsR/SmtB family transcription factor [Algoriphagus sp.]|uniref:ArsR/SmtB family transcription factor n=1 Tax=Algoriphagus sp. TaxID=1872435 RepID=UPI0025DD37DE|nr:metalloregulator ArsR/SmtB family transcription factor [Algoriphagus sp.]